jgi:hypothetical protein
MMGLLDRLNARERRLLTLTATVLGAAAIVLGGRQAIGSIRELNRQIADREQEIENLTQQNVQATAINAAYDRVVKEHSSALTIAEIHDALRREIFALTQVELPAKDDKPARTMQLVRIPTLQEGQLTQGVGHREYQIRFQIPAAGLDQTLSFLERIEASEQLLRIDVLDLARPPDSKGVSALLQITRTVLDNPEAAANPGAGR